MALSKAPTSWLLRWLLLGVWPFVPFTELSSVFQWQFGASKIIFLWTSALVAGLLFIPSWDRWVLAAASSQGHSWGSYPKGAQHRVG